MNKRKASTDLTKDNYLDGEDGSSNSCMCAEPVTELKRRSSEELLKLGKPIIRLKRSGVECRRVAQQKPAAAAPAKEKPKLATVNRAHEEEEEEEEEKRRSEETKKHENEETKKRENEETKKHENEEAKRRSEEKKHEIEEEESLKTPPKAEINVDEGENVVDRSVKLDSKDKEEGSGGGTLASDASALEASPGSIFGTLFSKPFTNPFLEAAKSGHESFSLFASPQSTSVAEASIPQVFVSPSIFSLPLSRATTSADHDKTDDVETTANGASVVASTPRPAHFPGEEDETEIFADANVVLLKCVAVESGSSSAEGEESKPTKSSNMKFRKQGEGILKLLTGKEANGGDKENAGCKRKRLVVRQKGTWTILLNSPLSLSKKFDLMPQMAAGYGVRFVGLDHTKAAASHPSVAASPHHVPLAAYCIKFDAAVKRQEFLRAAGVETA